jgi:hypothetical protein
LPLVLEPVAAFVIVLIGSFKKLPQFPESAYGNERTFARGSCPPAGLAASPHSSSDAERGDLMVGTVVGTTRDVSELLAPA